MKGVKTNKKIFIFVRFCTPAAFLQIGCRGVFASSFSASASNMSVASFFSKASLLLPEAALSLLHIAQFNADEDSHPNGKHLVFLCALNLK
ncbi:MAG: hypothetical protein IPH54_10585 [Rhodoferax sp.]|nr:hypothetical protein [Rhodoferax sp.]